MQDFLDEVTHINRLLNLAVEKLQKETEFVTLSAVGTNAFQSFFRAHENLQYCINDINRSSASVFNPDHMYQVINLFRALRDRALIVANVYQSWPNVQDDLNEVRRLAVAVDEALDRLYEKSPRGTHEVAHYTGILNELRTDLWKIKQDVKNIDDSVPGISNKVDEAIKKTLTNISTKEEEIENQKQKLDAYLSLSGEKLLLGDYVYHANNETFLAEVTRILSITCMVGVICGLYITINTDLRQIPLNNLLVKALLSLCISIPAIYLAKESARHRAQSYFYRTTALQLATLDPFLNSVPEPWRHEIKGKIGERIFSQPGDKPSMSEASPFDTEKLIVEIVKRMKQD